MPDRVRSVAAALAVALLLSWSGRPGAQQRLRRWAVAYDFVESFSSGKATNSPSTQVQVDRAGGAARSCIFQHPPLQVGTGPARLSFAGVSLPKVRAGERLALQVAVGMSDRIGKSPGPGADGCAFGIEIDGREVFRQATSEQRWIMSEVDLTAHAGRAIDVAFLVDPQRTSNSDWALWGDPRIVIVGRPWTPPVGPRADCLEVGRLDRIPIPDRLYERSDTTAGCAMTAVLDEHLDLACQLRRYRGSTPPPKVPLAPRLVVGEGEHPDNHTLIRVLGQYGIAEAQFLAWPPSVRGGVDVQAGRLFGGSKCIVASAIGAPAREIRVFDRMGLRLATIRPPGAINPPYTVAVGPFVDMLDGRVGDVVAVASRRPSGSPRIAFLDGRGTLLASHTLPRPVERLSLVRGAGSPAEMLACAGGSSRAWRVRFTAGVTGEIAVPPLADGPDTVETIGPSAYGHGLVASGPHDSRSTVVELPNTGGARVVDVGRYENLFWFQWYRPIGEGRYVRKSEFAHIRTDGASPAYRDPPFGRRDPDAWAGPEFVRRWGSPGADFARYATSAPKLWEPCFTHRAFKGGFDRWRAVTDPQTGLATYTMLSRNNKVAEYGEFGSIDFYASTYAYGLPDLDALYVQPLRAFLRELAVPFREKPEHCAGLEPNHEHEIAVDADASMGDYNLRMIAGFHGYLARMHGSGIRTINRKMGTTFEDTFDAPRKWDRGRWDAYDPANPFYRNWTDYNRYIVTRRVADTYREALLAGFPPEIVKCHQIPDTYAIGNLSAFSDITARFTPIDWMLNSGAGYGFTRYGVWYKREHDALQDANRAGFDAMTIGEYQALTPSVDDAYGQLRFMFDNGCVSAHCMDWPAAHDKGYNASMHAALQRLIAEDRPRPGLTGGVGQVRPFADGRRRCNIVSIGTGDRHTGLIKSVREDGSWEGTVYVVPFHAHVDVAEVPAPSAALLGAGRHLTLGPFQQVDSGQQIEIVFAARASGRPGRLVFQACRDGTPLPGLRHTAPVGVRERQVRYVLRTQLPADGLSLRIEAPGAPVRVRGLAAYRECERTPKLPRGMFAGKRHGGGVRFDILD